MWNVGSRWRRLKAHYPMLLWNSLFAQLKFSSTKSTFLYMSLLFLYTSLDNPLTNYTTDNMANKWHASQQQLTLLSLLIILNRHTRTYTHRHIQIHTQQFVNNNWAACATPVSYYWSTLDNTPPFTVARHEKCMNGNSKLKHPHTHTYTRVLGRIACLVIDSLTEFEFDFDFYFESK